MYLREMCTMPVDCVQGIWVVYGQLIGRYPYNRSCMTSVEISPNVRCRKIPYFWCNLMLVAWKSPFCAFPRYQSLENLAQKGPGKARLVPYACTRERTVIRPRSVRQKRDTDTIVKPLSIWLSMMKFGWCRYRLPGAGVTPTAVSSYSLGSMWGKFRHIWAASPEGSNGVVRHDPTCI